MRYWFMRPMVNLSRSSTRLLLIVPILFVLSLHGCAVMKNLSLKSSTKPPTKLPTVEGVPEEKIQRNDFSMAREDDVIGQPAFMKLQKGDTLPDIARHFSLGINEVSAANPGVDIWVPEAGERIILPLSHILPDSPRKGIVINLAAMRLFQFKGDSKSLAVSTYPVGIGTVERPSPKVKCMCSAKRFGRPGMCLPQLPRIIGKKGDPLPAEVLPGPQNPLGEYALYLSKPGYLIHGTNKPYSIGLKATNGCIRLYPENIKKLYE